MTPDPQANTSAPRPLPLFPLGTVLFPQGMLPLRIFELRYLEMIGQCLRTGEPFGIVLLSHGHEVRQPGQPEVLSDVGTCATVVAHQRPQPGLIHIECQGQQRFRLLDRHQEKNGLWVGNAQLLPPDDPVWTVPDDLTPAARLLSQLMSEAMDKASAGDAAGLAAQPSRLYQGTPHFDQSGWVADRWCEILPLPLHQKQQLLEVESPVLRLELVADLLRQNGLID
ncbi:MAG: Lon protease 2 [Paracidovorax wautersii]|uniref:Lon protease 2 n=1 Tax=Paracidovorax wautersii TaxID=1177982 RepID=A0A7V8JPT8_9BURK|nr:MAG: Lon protease 2 [Paracidovorax wautersii]